MAAKRKSKVVFYYITHTGRGSLGPKFKRLLRKSDVLDIEAPGGMPKNVAEIYLKIAAGDREAYGGFSEFIKRKYRETGSADSLHILDLVNALYGSKKKLVFEKPPRHVIKGTPALMAMTPSGRMASEVVRRTHARARKDSRRIADALEANPGQRWLVERGMAHNVTTEVLKRELEKRGVKAVVRDVRTPVMRSAIGTPYHTTPEEIVFHKVRLGREITERDMELATLMPMLTGYLTRKGWSINRIEPHLGALANEFGGKLLLSGGERAHLVEHPGEIRSFYLKRGIDIEKPWWSHEKRLRKKLKG
jgi:hypothetical protein